MRARRPHLIVVSVAVLAVSTVLSGAAGAQTVAGWSQFQGDAARTGATADGPAPGYRFAWKTGEPTGGPRGAYGLSAPVVGDGVVVATGPTRVVAFDLETGDVAWEVDRVLGPSTAPALAAAPEGPIVLFTEGWGAGPPDASATPTPSTSTPVPSDGAEEGPTTPRLVAAPAGGPGGSIWELDLPAVSRTGVTVAGDLALVGTIDGSLMAVDVDSGQEAWRADLGGFLDAPIAASTDLALVSILGDDDTAPAVVALSLADGSEAWRYEPQPATAGIGPPSIDGDTAFVAVRDATVRAIWLADGAERWRANVNVYVNPFAPASPPVLVDGGVIVADVRGQVYRFDAATGERVWDHAYNHPVVRSTPVVVEGHVIVATSDGRLAAFELAGGDLVWEGTASFEGATAPLLRSIGVAGDRLVLVRGGSGAGVSALEHDPAADLVRVVSPTILDPAGLVLGWLVAMAVAASAFVVGRALWRRLGPVGIPTQDELAGEVDA